MRNAVPHIRILRMHTMIFSKFEPNIIERGDRVKRKRKEQNGRTNERTNGAEEWTDDNNNNKKKKKKKQRKHEKNDI